MRHIITIAHDKIVTRQWGLRDERDERERRDEGSVWFVKVNETVLLFGFPQQSMIEGLVHPHSRFNQAI
jgi:hypothetical protein